MVGLKIYVEGGGNSNLLRTACRRGVSEFLNKAGLAGRMPRIVACGGRRDAYDAFCTPWAKGEPALLLVDSEAPVGTTCRRGKPDQWDPWLHLHHRQGDQWEKPDQADRNDCHLMVQCMEAWFLADRAVLEEFFGQGFNKNALPNITQVECIPKQQIYQSLAQATRSCKTKAKYGKGDHSFKLLALIDPDLVTAASPWAKRFIEQIKDKMGCR